MKKLHLLFAFVAVAFLFSCNKDDDNTTPISATEVNSTIVSGNWRITYYWDTDHDETVNYSGYSFVFGAGNTVTATKGTSVVTGTWATGTDDSKAKLILVFTTPATFTELSEDWHVTERTATKIVLQHVSGGSGGTDYLTFEKN